MASISSFCATQPASLNLPLPAQVQVRAGLLTEMMVRTRQSEPLTLLAIALLAWIHADQVAGAAILLWAMLMGSAAFMNWFLAGRFLRSGPLAELREEHVLLWQRIEIAAAGVLAAAWTSSLWLLDTGSPDGYFYFKMLMLIAVIGFIQGTQGIMPSVFAGFLIVFALLMFAFLASRPSTYERQAMVLQLSLLPYVFVLMQRSRVEHRRVREWIESRLVQQALVERLNELASRDSLTGAFSRAHVQQALRALASTQQRDGAPYSLLMFDVDRFKSINDERGHAVGDEVLRLMTAAIVAELRPADLWGRWGGEEFILVLPRTRYGAAIETAERLRARTEQLDFGPAAPGLRVTVSIGVAQSRPDEATDATILRADRALYRAKREGRNRVTLASVLS